MISAPPRWTLAYAYGSRFGKWPIVRKPSSSAYQPAVAPTSFTRNVGTAEWMRMAARSAARSSIIWMRSFAGSRADDGWNLSPARRGSAALRGGEARGLEGEIVVLGDACGPLRRGAVVGDGALGIARALVQVAADGVQAVVAGEPRIGVQRLKQLQPLLRSLHHRGGDRAVERLHRVVGHPLQQAVQGENLRPVRILRARRLVVHGGDGGLELVCAHRPSRERGRDERDPLRDQPLVPEPAVLLVEGDQLAAGTGAGGAARVGEQHQREQPRDLAVVGEEGVHRARQPDRLVGEVGALKMGAGA